MLHTAVYSFFSGIGFLDLGFEKNGFHIRLVNEYDPVFMSAYQYARKYPQDRKYCNESAEEFLHGGLKQGLAAMIREDRRNNHLVGFVGGPPCPDFSVAGKNKGASGENGRLTATYIELICQFLPDFFVLENVKGLFATKIHRNFLDRETKKLLERGYEVSVQVENALEYGAPQFRERLFVVGFRNARRGALVAPLVLQKRHTMDAILKKDWPREDPFAIDNPRTPPRGIYKRLSVEHWFEKNNVLLHPNANDCFEARKAERFLQIPEGRVSGKSFKRLHRWRYSPTAAYGHNEVHLHPYKPRRLSVAEALAIQSLPKDFVVLPSASLTAKFKMVGNGVPFLLAVALAQATRNELELRSGD